MRELKKKLRGIIRALKKKYEPQHENMSKALMLKLEHDEDFIQAQTVLLYYSMQDEVDTHSLVEKYASKKRILLPVVVNNDLELHLFTGELRVGEFGIMEPVGPLFEDYEQIDLVVVPGMAFSKAGHRMGRGKGFYDRLLPKLPHAKKVGLCFPYQVVKYVPTYVTDVRMDKVISL